MIKQMWSIFLRLREDLFSKSSQFFYLIPRTAVLLFGISVTLGFAFLASQSLSKSSQSKFESLAQRAVSDFVFQVESYVTMLESTKNLFTVHPGTSNEEFHRFIESSDFKNKFPGVIGFTYVPLIESKDRKKFLKEVQKRQSEFNIWPSGDRLFYAPILYIEPFNDDSKKLLGFDFLTDPIRKEAIEKARDLGVTVMSKKVSLVSLKTAKVIGSSEPLFAIFSPVYGTDVSKGDVSQRRNEILGYTAIAFKSTSMFQHVLGRLALENNLKIDVFEGPIISDRNNLIFSNLISDQTGDSENKFVHQKSIPVSLAGQDWNFRISTIKSLDGISANYIFFSITGLGLLVSLLLFKLWADYENFNYRLGESENQLRLVTDTIPALVAKVDAKGNFQFANSAHVNWFGIEEKEIIGASIFYAIRKFGDESARPYFERALRGERLTFETKVHHFKFGFRQVKIDCLGLVSREGKPDGFIALATDVTEVTRLVGKLKLSQKKYRAAFLENEKLYREAKRLNKAKDDFLGILSHELRTPLTVILGNAELMEGAAEDSVILKDSIQSILRNARLQSKLVDDLIEMSSIVTGTLSMNLLPKQICEFFEPTIVNMKLVAERKGLTFNSSLQNGQAMVNGDASRLHQVLVNLIANSIKFTPEGGTIFVTGSIKNDFYEIRVRDTGKGIESNYLPFVFDCLQQEDSSYSRSYGGLGLGLSIVRNLVESHGGSIRALSSGSNLGAEFIFQLPLHFKEPFSGVNFRAPRLVSSANKADHLGGWTSETLQNKTVLVVDDEPDALVLVERYLLRVGAKIYKAGSAKDALSILNEFSPDLIVSDISMPEEDGFSLIRKVRERERAKNLRSIPAIALTALAQESDRKRSYESGFQTHLAKPFTAKQLIFATAELVCPDRLQMNL